MPPLPLVVKSLIFFISDIGGYFSNISSLFPKALEYVLTNGLLNANNSRFYIDTNAVECIRNLSCECLGLFTPDLIYKTLQVSESALCNMSAAYGDKLVESIVSIISKLPTTEIIEAQRKVLIFILTELQAASPIGLQPRLQDYHKSIVFMAAAFGAMDEGSSREVWANLSDIISSTIEYALKGFCLYHNQENIATATYLLFRRVIKLVSTFADNFFPSICNNILEVYTPGKEDGIGVIITGISLLFNEPLTSQWLQNSYSKLFSTLSYSLSQNPSPDTISSFFDLQMKLYESGLPSFSC